MRINQPLLATGLLLSIASLNAEAALTVYTSAGQGVVYDNATNITWTADANLLGTLEASNPNLISSIISTIGSINDSPNFYDTPSNSGYHTLSTADFGSNGKVNWFGAQAFVGYLNSIHYAGSQQWALPTAGTAGVSPKVGYNQTGTQFGELFYTELHSLAGDSIPNTSTFSNEQTLGYWLGTEYTSTPYAAWQFYTANGNQDYNVKVIQFYAWAVSPGQVSAVPVPAAIWLMGSSLLGLLGLKRFGYAR